MIMFFYFICISIIGVKVIFFTKNKIGDIIKRKQYRCGICTVCFKFGIL